MPQRIDFNIPVPFEGVRRDLPQNLVPPTALIDSENMVFRRGRFQPRYGTIDFASNNPGASVGIVSYMHADGTARLVLGTTVGWWRYNSGTGAWVDITGSALTASGNEHIIFRVFQKDGATHLLGINDQINTMKKWDGSAGTYSDVSGTPPLAKCMMILANRVLLFNLADNGAYSGVVSPVGYDVSAFNDFDSGWGTTLNGLLNQTPGPIVAALEMGSLQGAIYKTDSIFTATAQGGTVPFHFEARVHGIVGPVNSRCVVATTDGRHIFLGSDGALYQFDGVGVQSLGYHIQKQILDSCDGIISQFETTAWMMYDNERNEIQIHYQDGSSSARFWCVVNLENNSIWPMTWLGTEQALSDGCGARVTIPGTAGTSIIYGSVGTWQESLAEDETSTDITILWETPLSDLGAPGFWKTVCEVDHLFQFGVDDPRNPSSGNESVTIVTRYSDGGEVPSSLETSQSFTVSAAPTNSYVTDHRGTAKLVGFRYSGTVDKLFEYRGASGYAMLRGAR